MILFLLISYVSLLSIPALFIANGTRTEKLRGEKVSTVEKTVKKTLILLASLVHSTPMTRFSKFDFSELRKNYEKKIVEKNMFSLKTPNPEAFWINLSELGEISF